MDRKTFNSISTREREFLMKNQLQLFDQQDIKSQIDWRGQVGQEFSSTPKKKKKNLLKDL